MPAITPTDLIRELERPQVHVFAQSAVQGRNDYVASFLRYMHAEAYTCDVSDKSRTRWPGRRFYIYDTRSGVETIHTVIDGIVHHEEV